MLTKEQLNEIKQRCEAATPGPWRAVEKGNSVPSHAVVTVAYDGEPQQHICSGISPKTANSNFIEHTITDIPALLQHIEELERRQAMLEKVLKEAGNWHCESCGQIIEEAADPEEGQPCDCCETLHKAIQACYEE